MLRPTRARARHFKYLRHETDVWLEVTTLLIPGENDSEAEIEKASAWFAANLGPDVPWHFTAFHPDYKMLDKPPTPPATLTRARAIARAKGLRTFTPATSMTAISSAPVAAECLSATSPREQLNRASPVRPARIWQSPSWTLPCKRNADLWRARWRAPA